MNSKRKRDVVDDSEDDGFSDNSPDAKLARRLQDEEDEAAAQILSVSKPTIGLRRSLRGLADPLVTSPASLSKAEHDGTDSAASTLRGSSGKATALGSRSSAGFRRKQIMIVKDSEDEDSAAEQVDEESDSDAEGVNEESDSDASSFKPLSKRRPGAAAASRRPIRLREPTAAPTPAPGEYPDGVLFLENPGGNSESLDDFDFDGFLPAHSGEESDGFTFPLNIDDDDDDHPGAPGTLDQAIRTATMSRRAYRAYRSGRRLKRDRGRLELHHPELTTMWKDLENMPVLKAGKAEQPNSISRQLKPFQLEGLAWMKAMENTEWKGGLLGDEMGLGKTIQAVSLIMSDFPARKPSLVLVPPVALMQWMTEIDSYTDGRLKTLVFHGTNAKSKNLTVKELKGYNVIIMSYNSLESMYRKQEKGFKRKDGVFKEKSIIHQTEFHRVILDEAHCIKTRTTMTAKACFALKVTYRWCLSGTPLQNRIGEFFSLVRFLNIRPFACYLCKHCPCSTLEWQMDDNNNCTACGHGGMRHVSVFNQELLNPIQKYGNMGPGREAFRKLRILTDRIMLRRLKKDHTDSMELPVKEINVERQFFGEEENDFANSIMTSGQRKFDTYVASGVLLNNYANIFGLIMQMRQVADHPDLILKKNSEGGQNILVCSICDEPAEDAIRSRCKHDFCRTCVKSYLNSSMEPNCPRCHIPLSIDLEQPEIEQDEAMVKKSSIINRIKMENWTSSSKIELLVHELHKLRSDKASHKSIIFSQFTTMLQLIEWRLRRAGITTVMLDGSMTPAQRQASIEHFMKNVDVECFLVSLKAGGVALNLTEASHVFIVDPWWNPAAYVALQPEIVSLDPPPPSFSCGIAHFRC
jgi:DNA repair protein RAD16